MSYTPTEHGSAGPWFLGHDGFKRHLRDHDGNNAGYELLDGDTSKLIGMADALSVVFDFWLRGHSLSAGSSPYDTVRNALAKVREDVA